MIRNFRLITAFTLLASAPVVAAPICETGGSAKSGDSFVSARFCKDGESIVIHYIADSTCQIDLAGGTLFNKADPADAKGHINAKWSHSLPGVYVCN